ncbi:uncharacterized protein LOC128397172 [Panonychus citri]|uniref:uncharacterized protein LOC128397172 n=1 Tax=Panonychus citri TaxID=50023 RepID=UPI00230707BF|nr:uncharacterized protein LOC128397172 [Panonychus citri]
MSKNRPSSPSNRPPSRPSSRSSVNKPNRLPGDSVLFAPVYQEEKLENLHSKLKESTFDVTLIKEKLLEKAKATLNLTRLPQSGSFIPFFHFDEFSDVHLSFLQHNPPYTPWFSITETYFGPGIIELHKSVYNILIEHQNERYGPEQTEQINPTDHDFLIDIELDDSYQPSYTITNLN